MKCVSGECYQPCRENSSWYISSDYLVQQIFNQSPPATVYWLLLQPVNHRQQPVTSRLALTCCGSMSTVFARKIYFLCIDQYLFKTKKYFISIFITFLYAQLVNTSLDSYFGPKYFVCSTARISRGRFSVKAGRFLSKQGVSTTIKYPPSCYNKLLNDFFMMQINHILASKVNIILSLVWSQSLSLRWHTL